MADGTASRFENQRLRQNETDSAPQVRGDPRNARAALVAWRPKTSSRRRAPHPFRNAVHGQAGAPSAKRNRRGTAARLTYYLPVDDFLLTSADGPLQMSTRPCDESPAVAKAEREGWWCKLPDPLWHDGTNVGARRVQAGHSDGTRRKLAARAHGAARQVDATRVDRLAYAVGLLWSVESRSTP